jgi:hypothetical protein
MVNQSILNRSLTKNVQNWLIEGSRLQWLQGPSKVNEDNMSDVRREARRHIRKKREHLKEN